MPAGPLRKLCPDGGGPISDPRRCLRFQRRRAAGPHLPYPSSPRGRGGDKKEAFFGLSPLSPSGREGPGGGGPAAWHVKKEDNGGDRGWEFKGDLTEPRFRGGGGGWGGGGR